MLEDDELLLVGFAHSCRFGLDHSRGPGGRIPCGVTARGSPSGPLQFDRLGNVDVREIVDHFSLHSAFA
jgi:hypothetical protein